MPEMQTRAQRVRMHGNQLIEARKMKGFSSRSSFVDALRGSGKPTISLSTLQRAEESQSIDSMSAKYICDFLDKEFESLINIEIDTPTIFEPRFAGKWTYFFIECDAYKKYGIVQGLCEILFDGKQYSGIDYSDNEKTKICERIISAKIIRNIVMGETITEESVIPYGCGQFMARFQRGDNWLDGVSIWYDGDTESIEWTRDIWIRTGCRDESDLINLAKHEMEVELEKRNLTQTK